MAVRMLRFTAHQHYGSSGGVIVVQSFPLVCCLWFCINFGVRDRSWLLDNLESDWWILWRQICKAGFRKFIWFTLNFFRKFSLLRIVAIAFTASTCKLKRGRVIISFVSGILNLRGPLVCEIRILENFPWVNRNKYNLTDS